MKRLLRISAGVCIAAMLIFACVVIVRTTHTDIEIPDSPVPLAEITEESAHEVRELEIAYSAPAGVADNQEIYSQDGYGDGLSIVYMYLTVRQGNKAESSDKTWSELTVYSAPENGGPESPSGYAECILQEGDKSGPAQGCFGYGLTIPNGVVQVRSGTSPEAVLKSYRIQLKDGAEQWRGQSIINLDKHPDDNLRIRNKLTLDLMREIPGLISLRTQFVHLYIKDETAGSRNNGFIDYGLFTQAEQPDRSFLENHGLDVNGHLYMASMFEFANFNNEIRLTDDPNFDQEGFDHVLESRGNNDHSELLDFIRQINDFSIPTEEIFKKYLDESNYFTWLAFQILTGNADTVNRNFLLYSPLSSEKWYFILWNADSAFKRIEYSMFTNGGSPLEMEYGLGSYWGVALHRRIFMSTDYLAKLDAYVDRVYTQLAEKNVALLAAEYYAAVVPLLTAAPDKEHIYEDIDNDYILENLQHEIALSYELYLKSRNELMPFYLWIPERTEKGYEFRWDSTYSFEASTMIFYSFKLASDLYFENLIYSEDGIYIPYVFFEDTLPEGTYYCAVTAYDQSGRTCAGKEYVIDEYNNIHYGVIEFMIDGKGGASRVVR